MIDPPDQYGDADDHENMFREIVEYGPDALLVVDAQGVILTVNAQAEKLFGYAREEMLGKNVELLVPERFRDHHREHRRRFGRHPHARPMGIAMELLGRHKDGLEFPVEVSLSPLRTRTGSLVAASVRDISERRAVQEELFFMRERAQITLRSIGDGVLCTDIAGHVTYLNPVAETMTGWGEGDALGRRLAEVYCVRDDVSGRCVDEFAGAAVARNMTIAQEADWLLTRRDGFETPVEQTISPIHDWRGEVVGAVIVFRDVREARALAQQMSHLAQYDYLTRLPNRMLFRDRLNQALAAAQRYHRRLAVLYIDIDRFKYINDSLGHSVGDQLLAAVAARLLNCVRTADTVSRFGGDEFVLLLSEIENREAVMHTAQKILQELGSRFDVGEHSLMVSASIGVSLYPEDGADADALLRNADTAMYHAKSRGRNNVQFFDAQMHQRSSQRRQLEDALRRAVQEQGFTLHYQPKINLADNSVMGVEALLRWDRPGVGATPPLDFIPVAEDCGLILPIGQWVLREACGQARRWRDQQLPALMAVNISIHQLRDPDFQEQLCAIVAEQRLDPGQLELEVSEAALEYDPAAARVCLEALHAQGFRLAIDGFGATFPSLNFLRRFPIDELKLDRSLLQGAISDHNDAAVMRGVVDICRSFNRPVVAEGVELPEQLAFLRTIQCHAAQGLYLGEPVNAAAMTDFLRQHRVRDT